MKAGLWVMPACCVLPLYPRPILSTKYKFTINIYRTLHTRQSMQYKHNTGPYDNYWYNMSCSIVNELQK